MAKIVVTGATGNVGMATLRALQERPHSGLDIMAGVREVKRPHLFPADLKVIPIHFDLTAIESFGPALAHADAIFLLLPPRVANGVNYFGRLIQEAKNQSVKHLVYLSVQGADKASFIPHHQIEKQIKASGLSYTLLRPSYFMQNFTTVLLPDLRDRRELFLPAGRALFNLIDVRDIGAVAAEILLNPQPHTSHAYELTTPENITFKEIAQLFSAELNQKVTYHSPSLWSFYFRKKREGLAASFIFIMMLLHFLPRFQKPPGINNWVQQITGKEPNTLAEFIRDHRLLFESKP